MRMRVQILQMFSNMPRMSPQKDKFNFHLTPELNTRYLSTGNRMMKLVDSRLLGPAAAYKADRKQLLSKVNLQMKAYPDLDSNSNAAIHVLIGPMNRN